MAINNFHNYLYNYNLLIWTNYLFPREFTTSLSLIHKFDISVIVKNFVYEKLYFRLRLKPNN